MSDGRDNFRASIDTTQFMRDAEAMKKKFSDVGNNAVAEGSRIDSTLRKAGQAMGAYFTFQAASSFVNQLVSIRGEFQQLEIAFTTMLKSKEKSDKLMREITQFAATTPFDLKQVAGGTKQLLAYGFAAEDMTTNLSMLGNIASGVGSQIGDLIYLYGTLKASGRVTSMDLNQFAGRGIPIYESLAAAMGIAKEEVREYASAGKIGFKDIEKAFQGMTGESGMFYNLMQEQSKSLTGQISNLGDAVDSMFNDIGKNTEGVLSDSIKGASYLVENYETVGKTIASLIVVFGAYKTALITLNVIEGYKNGLTLKSILLNYQSIASKGAETVATDIFIAATKKQTAAQIVNNATLLASPYVLVGIAVIGLAAAMWVLYDGTTAAERAQASLDDRIKEQADSVTEQKDEVKSLIGVIKEETSTLTQKQKALDDLQAKFPNIFKNMDMEMVKHSSLVDITRELNLELERRNLLSDKKLATDGADILGKTFSDGSNRFFGSSDDRNKAEDLLGLSTWQSLIKTDEKKIEMLHARTNAMNTKIFEDAKLAQDANFKAMDSTGKIEELKRQNIELQKQKDIMSSIGMLGDFSVKSIDEQILKNTQSMEDFKKSSESGVKKNKTYWDDLKTSAETALGAMDVKDKGSTEWNKEVENIKKAKLKIEKYNAVEKKDTKKKDDEALNQAILSSQLTLEKARLEIMIDGDAKRKEQNKIAFQDQIRAIEKERTEMLAKYKEKGIAMPEIVTKTLDERVVSATESKAFRDTEIDKEAAEKIQKINTSLTDVFLNEEELKRESIKRTYEEMRKQAGVELAGGTIDQKQYDDRIGLISNAETEQQKQRLLSSVEDFKKKEADITSKYNTLITDAEIMGNEELVARLAKLKAEALSEMQSDMLMKSDEWKNLFLNLDNMTAEQIDGIVANLEGKINGVKLDPADLKALIDQLKNAKNVSLQLKSENPFKAIVAGIDTWIVAQKKLNAAKKDGKKTGQEVGDLGELKKNSKEAASAVAGEFEKVNSMIGGIGSSLSGVFASFGDDETAAKIDGITKIAGGALTAGAGVAKIASGDVVGGITDLAKGIGDVIVGINGMSDAEKQEKINSIQKDIDSLGKAYEKLGREINKAYSVDKAKKLQQQNENLKQQNADIQKQIAAEQDKKDTDKDAIKGYQEQIEANNLKIADSVDTIMEAITGTTVMQAIDDFAQAYADAWASGEDAALASTNVVKNILKNSLIAYMKGQMSDEVAAVMNKIEESMQNDGRIDASEQAAIDALVAALDKKAAQYEAGLSPYLKTDEKTKSGVTGELQSQMTEGTGSQLVGLWNMTAMDIRSIRDLLFSKLTDGIGLVMDKNTNSQTTGNLSQGIFEQTLLIQRDTFRIANNTDGLIPALNAIKAALGGRIIPENETSRGRR